jgi:LasA protease
VRIRTKLTLFALVASIVPFVGALPASAGDGSAELSLPWAEGETWTVSSGIHSWTGDPQPTSSLDFSGGSGYVRAAGPGVAHRDGTCGPSLVRIDHSNGWHTSYYHLENIVVDEGQRVERGDLLGEIGEEVACGGSATAPHVHFTLWKFNDAFGFRADQEASLVDVDLGGWNVSSTGYRQACLRRITDGRTQCAPGGQVYNDGTVGSGSTTDIPEPVPFPQ